MSCTSFAASAVLVSAVLESPLSSPVLVSAVPESPPSFPVLVSDVLVSDVLVSPPVLVSSPVLVSEPLVLVSVPPSCPASPAGVAVVSSPPHAAHKPDMRSTNPKEAAVARLVRMRRMLREWVGVEKFL
jgi:hypothetical protein